MRRYTAMRRHPFMIAAVAVVALIAAALIFVLTFGFERVFERRASAALGQPVAVESARVKIFPLRLVLKGLVVGQPEPQPMMTAGEIDATIGFWALLAGNFKMPRLAVIDSTTVVERRPDGTSNWSREPQEQQPPQPAEEPKLPEINDLMLANTVMKIRDPKYKTNLVIRMDTGEPGETGERPLLIKGEGTFQGERTTISATAGSILSLRDETQPYPIDGKLVSGPTEISVKGTVIDPVHIAGLNVKLRVSGQDAADLYRITGIALPASPPYKIVTDIDRDGLKWVMTNMDWKVGNSDLSGSMTWDLSNPKPRLEGKLKASVIDMDDLGGFVGAAPGKAVTPDEVKVEAAQREKERRAEGIPPEEETRAQEKAQAKNDKADRKADDQKQDAKKKEDEKPAERRVADKLVVSDQPINFEKIHSMNADVTLNAGRIVNFVLPVDNLSAHFVLNDGVVKLQPLAFGVESGRIVAELTLNAAGKPVRTDALVKIENYPINRLLGESKTTTIGALGGRIELHGTGESPHRLLASSDGSFGMIAQGGSVSQLVVAVLGLQLAEAFGILITEDQPTPIRCVAADFGIQNGLMNTRALVFDTEKSIITGEGTVDLGGETLDMKLKPKPKKVSIGVLRVPFKVSGSFDNPAIGPDAGALAARGGIAAALGVVLSPFASLLAMIEGGGGKDADCAALFAQTQENTDVPKSAAGLKPSTPPPPPSKND